MFFRGMFIESAYMNDKLRLLTEKLDKLKALQPLPKDLIGNLEDWFRVELTYSSNAIEGNTLTRVETAEVIERGVTAVISGKPLKDLLEARNHAQAIALIKKLASERKSHQFITEDDIKAIQKIILTGIHDDWAGVYRNRDVIMQGSNDEFPRPNEIPHLMKNFVLWLQTQQEAHPVRIAADAHYKFVCIHPFLDGNGRTARLLMNLILVLNNYPMAVIRNEDRAEYIETFKHARHDNNMEPFYTIIEDAVLRSLDAYINSAEGKPVMPMLTGELPLTDGTLLRIGQLAKSTNETVHTLRFWTKEGLLKPKEVTESGYQLYDMHAVKQAKTIRFMQDIERHSLKDIKNKLGVKNG
jgi:Fic family protein